MDEKELTLRDLLFPSHPGMPEDVWSYLEASQPLVRLREKLAGLSPGHDWEAEARRIREEVLSLLDIGVARGVLLKAWNEGRLLRKYVGPGTSGPGEILEVGLVDHALRSTHRPRVEMALNQADLDPIELDVTVVVQVRSAVVEIRDGRVVRLRTGELTGKSDLKVGGFLLVSERFQGMSLKGERVLPEGGVPIEA